MEYVQSYIQGPLICTDACAAKMGTRTSVMTMNVQLSIPCANMKIIFQGKKSRSYIKMIAFMIIDVLFLPE